MRLCQYTLLVTSRYSSITSLFRYRFREKWCEVPKSQLLRTLTEIEENVNATSTVHWLTSLITALIKLNLNYRPQNQSNFLLNRDDYLRPNTPSAISKVLTIVHLFARHSTVRKVENNVHF